QPRRARPRHTCRPPPPPPARHRAAGTGVWELGGGLSVSRGHPSVQRADSFISQWSGERERLPGLPGNFVADHVRLWLDGRDGPVNRDRGPRQWRGGGHRAGGAAARTPSRPHLPEATPLHCARVSARLTLVPRRTGETYGTTLSSSRPTSEVVPPCRTPRCPASRSPSACGPTRPPSRAPRCSSSATSPPCPGSPASP